MLFRSVVAGMIAGIWATGGGGAETPRSRLVHFVVFGAGLLAAGYLFRSLHGFHKNDATESWVLASSGWTLLVYALFYFLMDMRGWQRWATIFQPAGRNPLLAYIFPSIIIYFLIAMFDFKV